MGKFSYEAVDETKMVFELPDGHNINGLLRGSLEDPLAVIVHGIGGRANDPLPYLGARYLWENAGIASLRLSLYDYHPNARKRLEHPADIYTHDIGVVIDSLREQKVSKLYGIAHSMGALFLMEAKPDLDAAVLWDPSHGSFWQAAKFDDLIRFGQYAIFNDGPGFVLTNDELNYIETVGDTTDWAKGLGFPLAVISAQKAGAVELGARYVEVADGPKQHTVLDAGHLFEDSDSVIQQLFMETTGWLTRF